MPGKPELISPAWGECSIDESDIRHLAGVAFGIHEDLVPVMQRERGVIAVTHGPPCINRGIADAALPAPAFRTGCDGEYLFIFGLAHTVRMPVADEDAFASRAEDFGNHVGLARTTADRFVFQHELGIHVQAVSRHEEPFSLSEKRPVVTADPFASAESGVVRGVAHAIGLQRELRLNDVARIARNGGHEPLALVVSAEETVFRFPGFHEQ